MVGSMCSRVLVSSFPLINVEEPTRRADHQESHPCGARSTGPISPGASTPRPDVQCGSAGPPSGGPPRPSAEHAAVCPDSECQVVRNELEEAHRRYNELSAAHRLLRACLRSALEVDELDVEEIEELEAAAADAMRAETDPR